MRDGIEADALEQVCCQPRDDTTDDIGDNQHQRPGEDIGERPQDFAQHGADRLGDGLDLQGVQSGDQHRNEHEDVDD